MGGPGAPDDISQAPVTQAWPVASDGRAADATGEWFCHRRPRRTAVARCRGSAELFDYCAVSAGVPLPPSD
ncbi:hypothetical protein GCM10022207_92960 [Streptomyces lannensis]|uniref:Uncharacterized protein n=1 Tax=Streptomyces lannensis TaxID=766498 RepID=A0ABP7LXI3_9ACTN